MTPPLGPCVWVFHSGALGDHVMIWPFVRALARQGTAVTVVASSSHARLCEAEVRRQATGASGPVRGLGAEQPRFTRMWAGECASQEWIVRGVDAVVSPVADDSTDIGLRWLDAAGAMFPGAAVIGFGAPDSVSRAILWGRANAREWGSAAPLPDRDGPITLFAGAGGASKRWPIEQWVALAAAIRERTADADVHLLAGPVEAEMWSSAERGEFAGAGGRVLEGDLSSLADAIRASRVFVGCDTGPTHLGAQLGVPTLALFGPTDAQVWSPVGPRVRVLAPASPRSMEWLGVETVLAEALAMTTRGVKLT